MGLTKTEINLRRLLAALPEQTNQAKLAHYLLVLREQLALLTGETGRDLPSISDEKAKEYAEQIEALALKINSETQPDIWESLQTSEAQTKGGQTHAIPTNASSLVQFPELASDSSGLRRRKPPDRNDNDKPMLNGSTLQLNETHGPDKNDDIKPVVKLDPSKQQLIQKHRQLQEDLTDEMVKLAHEMKEKSLMMNRSLMDSEKVLDSTEHAIEHSLATTNRANLRANEIYAHNFKTGCLTWLIIFVMSCMFLSIVFLIRLT